MAKASGVPGWQRALVILASTVVGVVVVAALYWAQAVLIPVALAVFLTFLLTPPVRALQRLGLGRIPSIIVVVTLAALLLGGLGWLVARQVTGLMAELPNYTANIKAKIQNVREWTGAAGGDRFEQMVEEIAEELNPGGTSQGQPAGRPAWLAQLPTYLGSAVEALGGLALALVLVIFMLFSREDLRNRFLRLVGHGRMPHTTKAVDEATHRISRYLLMQAVVNSTYGLALGVGLFVLRVDYALLWGFLAAVLRYVPYVGPWVASLFPITLSLAMSEGWWQPLAVIGLFLVIELISNNVMEPRLYGKSMGVSEVALLIAAAFWAWLWGPIGLVLSAPLTVCLVVLGRYVPQLGFLDVLLGDEPVLKPDVVYYQRLLARDQDEATDLVLAQVKAEPPEQVYDTLLVPALAYARRDREHDDLTDADEAFVLQGTQEILEDLGERRAAEAAEAAEGAGGAPAKADEPPGPRVRFLACPARDEADRLALEMLRQLLDPARWEMELTGPEALTAEVVERVAAEEPALVCISALPPGGLAHTRYLCKRLRARFPGVKILVGRWGLGHNVENNRAALQEAGADRMETTLLEARNHLHALLPVLAQEKKARADGPAKERRKVSV